MVRNARTVYFRVPELCNQAYCVQITLMNRADKTNRTKSKKWEGIWKYGILIIIDMKHFIFYFIHYVHVFEHMHTQGIPDGIIFM